MNGPDPSTLWRAAEQSKRASLKPIIWGPGKLYWYIHVTLYEERMLKTSTLGETTEIFMFSYKRFK